MGNNNVSLVQPFQGMLILLKSNCLINQNNNAKQKYKAIEASLIFGQQRNYFLNYIIPIGYLSCVLQLFIEC